MRAILMIVFLVAPVPQVASVMANPYYYTGEVPPDKETYPPAIAVTSPANNTVYNTSLVPFTFNVTAPQSKTAASTTVQSIIYKADWYNEAVDVLVGDRSFDLQFTNVPEGQHSILITATGYGLYKETELSYKWFFIRSAEIVIFTVDCTAPTVVVLPFENVSSTSDVTLNFTVNEAYSKVTYSLNGQQNVTVNGNSTIPYLPAGQYNVTFYVWDNAGNIGTSQTTNFIVAQTLQPAKTETVDNSILYVSVVALSTAAIIGCIFLFRRHRKIANLKQTRNEDLR